MAESADPPVKPPRRPKQATGSKRGGDRTSQASVHEAAHRRAEVIRLKQAGLSFDSIAQQLGYADHSGAAKAWREAIADVVRVPAADAVLLEEQRLDALLLAIWTAATRAKRPNLGAVDRALAIHKARVQLLGIGGSIKIDVTSDEAREEVVAVVAELLGVLDSHGPVT